jgi:hypothetical protein
MKSAAFIVSIWFCALVNAQNGDINLSSWRTGDKLEKSDYHLIKKSKLYCALSNDNDFLIINLMVPDNKVANMILEKGFTIWINMDGKQVRKLGVRFPIGSENSTAVIYHDSEKSGSIEDLIVQANTIEIIGFISEQERHFAAQNNDNFRGYVKFSASGDFYYRLVMPLGKLPVRNSKDGNGAMPFALGFESGYLPAASKKGQSNSEKHKDSEVYWINGVRLATSK